MMGMPTSRYVLVSRSRRPDPHIDADRDRHQSVLRTATHTAMETEPIDHAATDRKLCTVLKSGP